MELTETCGSDPGAHDSRRDRARSSEGIHGSCPAQGKRHRWAPSNKLVAGAGFEPSTQADDRGLSARVRRSCQVRVRAVCGLRAGATRLILYVRSCRLFTRVVQEMWSRYAARHHYRANISLALGSRPLIRVTRGTFGALRRVQCLVVSSA